MDEWSRVVNKLDNSAAPHSKEHLNNLITLSLNLDIRQNCSLSQINVIKRFACDLISETVKEQLTEDLLDNVSSALKLLRNLCASVASNQTNIGEEVFVKKISELIIWSAKQPQNLSIITLEKTSVQLLGNICVENRVGQTIVWNQYYPHIISSLLYMEDYNIGNLGCMVLITCIQNSQERLSELTNDREIMGCIITTVLNVLKISEDTMEWMILLLEYLLQTCSLQCLCDVMPPCDKTVLLEYLLAYADIPEDISQSGPDTKPNFFFKICSSNSNLLFLQSQFNKLISLLQLEESCLSSLYHSSANKEKEILLKTFLSFLSLLCQCSCQVNLLQTLQQDESLLKSSLDLLSSLSKLDGSIVSARHLSQPSSSSERDATDHPFYGLKRDLVQFIGNLCYHCQDNQDIVRDYLPLLLNQCNIDHINPYIMQWSLWAIRNACEENPANQALIKQVEQKGVLNMQQIEKEFGCEVEIDENGKLRMKKNQK